MAFDADELFVPGNGHLYVAPTTTTAPTDASSALNAAFAEYGYISENGANLTPTTAVNPIRGWQAFGVLRYVVTSRDFNIGLELMQWNEDTLALWLGGATVTPGAGAENVITPPDPSTLDTRSFVLEGIDGSRTYRVYVPVGMVTESGQTTWQRSGASLLPVTIATLTVGDADPYTIFTDDAEFPAYPD